MLLGWNMMGFVRFTHISALFLHFWVFSAPIRMWRRSPVLRIPIIREPPCCVIRKHHLNTRRRPCRACLSQRGATARARTPARAVTRRATRDDSLTTTRRQQTCLWASTVARFPCRTRRRMSLQRNRYVSTWCRWQKWQKLHFSNRKWLSFILFSRNPCVLWHPLLFKRTTEQKTHALCGRPETFAHAPLSRWMYYLFLSSSFRFL